MTSGSRRIPAVNMTCPLCGAYSMSSGKIPHAILDCPMSKNKAHLLSTLQKIHNALSTVRFDASVNSNQYVMRLLVRKSLIELYLHGIGSYLAFNGFDIVEYKAPAPITPFPPHPPQHPPYSAAQHHYDFPGYPYQYNPYNISRSFPYNRNEVPAVNDRNVVASQKQPDSLSDINANSHLFKRRKMESKRPHLSSSSAPPQINGTPSDFDNPLLDDDDDDALDVDQFGLSKKERDTKTHLTNGIKNWSDLMINDHTPINMNLAPVDSLPAAVNCETTEKANSLSNMDAENIEDLLDNYLSESILVHNTADTPNTGLGDEIEESNTSDYYKFLKALNSRHEFVLDDDDGDCIVEFDLKEPIEEYLDSEISNTELEALFDEDNDDYINDEIAQTIIYEPNRPLMTDEMIDRFKQQMNANFQLIIQNLVISRELGPIGGYDTTKYWTSAVNRLYDVYNNKSCIEELHLIPLVKTQMEIMPICTEFGETVRKKKNRRKVISLPSHVTGLLKRFKSFKKSLEPRIIPLITSRPSYFSESEDNLLFLGVWNYSPGMWSDIREAVLPHRSEQTISNRYKNLTCRRSANEIFKNYRLQSTKPMKPSQKRRLKEILEEDFRNVYSAVKEFGRPPGQLMLTYYEMVKKRAEKSDSDVEDEEDEEEEKGEDTQVAEENDPTLTN